MKFLKFACIAAFAVGSLPALAQVKCTMPNGIVITQQLSSSCPVGAIKGQTLDGKPVALSMPAEKKKTPVVSQTPSATQPATKPAPVTDNTYDSARAICKLMEIAGATTCEIKSNIFSTSTIEATLATSPRDASQSCRLIATTMRGQTKSFESKDWKLLIFSPFSGNRPIAACEL